MDSFATVQGSDIKQGDLVLVDNTWAVADVAAGYLIDQSTRERRWPLLFDKRYRVQPLAVDTMRCLRDLPIGTVVRFVGDYTRWKIQCVTPEDVDAARVAVRLSAVLADGAPGREMVTPGTNRVLVEILCHRGPRLAADYTDRLSSDPKLRDFDQNYGVDLRRRITEKTPPSPWKDQGVALPHVGSVRRGDKVPVGDMPLGTVWNAPDGGWYLKNRQAGDLVEGIAVVPEKGRRDVVTLVASARREVQFVARPGGLTRNWCDCPFMHAGIKQRRTECFACGLLLPGPRPLLSEVEIKRAGGEPCSPDIFVEGYYVARWYSPKDEETLVGRGPLPHIALEALEKLVPNGFEHDVEIDDLVQGAR